MRYVAFFSSPTFVVHLVFICDRGLLLYTDSLCPLSFPQELCHLRVCRHHPNCRRFRRHG
jgi:hypothetical protein